MAAILGQNKKNFVLAKKHTHTTGSVKNSKVELQI